MDLLGWLKGRGAARAAPGLTQWRERWQAAAAVPDPTQVGPLRAALDALNLPAEEVEIENEMLEALRDLADLTAVVRATALPTIETGHRVVGSDRCHFTAPASMPDEPAQPSGTLLLTSNRAIFAGGGGGASMPWHSVATASQLDRDLVLIRSDREQLYRFRCNSFSDALRAAFIARELMAARRRPRL
jgi:hypothetical protein